MPRMNSELDHTNPLIVLAAGGYLALTRVPAASSIVTRVPLLASR
jgi:hypothetical protein